MEYATDLSLIKDVFSSILSLSVHILRETRGNAY